MKPIIIIAAMTLGATAVACGGSSTQTPEPATPGSEESSSEKINEHPDEARPRARAELTSTEGNSASGVLRFFPEAGGVRVLGSVEGLTPNAEHGFHVHEKGDCSAADGSSAGGHFNPEGHDHGQQGHDNHHLGDMNNLKSNAEGVAEVDLFLARAQLNTGNKEDLVGRGVIVHKDRDDYSSQPAGNAGARIACGAIVKADY